MFCSTLAESKKILKKESVLQILLGYIIEKIPLISVVFFYRPYAIPHSTISTSYSDKYISNNIECNNIILIIIYNY